MAQITAGSVSIVMAAGVDIVEMSGSIFFSSVTLDTSRSRARLVMVLDGSQATHHTTLTHSCSCGRVHTFTGSGAGQSS